MRQPDDVLLDRCSLRYNGNLAESWDARHNKAQMFIDSECMRLMSPLTPKRTGYLKGPAVINHTKVGSGKIQQRAPYARRQYYEHKSKARWFEVMKARYKSQILKGAKQIMDSEA